MLGVLVNTAAVALGGLIGLLCKRGIPPKVNEGVMTAVDLCVLYVGISGSLKGQNTIVLVLSMVLGAAVGALIDLDGQVVRLGNWVEKTFPAGADGKVPVAQGFVTASLVMCVGAMAVVGSLNAGLTHDYEILFTKSLMDFPIAIMLAVSLGVGVVYSAASILVFQGAIALLAGAIQPLLLQNGALEEVICAGSLMIVALALNMLGLTKIKVANYLPALVFAPLLCWLFSLLPAL